MCITVAKTHDKNFLKDIRVLRHSMLVFDKAYNYYKQFADWPEQGIYFVTRQKDNAVYVVADEISRTVAKKDAAAVLREEYIEIEDNSVEKSMMMLRRICYQDEKNRHYVFITNNIDVSAAEIALIYKKK